MKKFAAFFYGYFYFFGFSVTAPLRGISGA